ncbi:MAG: hypothetical protein ACRCXZ_05300 [Patescibacteria group bacterium]
MLRNFLRRVRLEWILDIWNNLNRRGKLTLIGIVLLILAIVGLLIFASVWNSQRQTQQNNEDLTKKRKKVSDLGNPFNLPKNHILNKYPQLIRARIDNGTAGSLYVLDVNTTMLRDPSYNELFENYNNIQSSLETKPSFYSDQYQMYYNIDDDQLLNPFARMMNFHEIVLNGEKKWFYEEPDSINSVQDSVYWVSEATTDLPKLKKVIRNNEIIPAYQRLQQIGPSKFLIATKDLTKNKINFATIALSEESNSATISSETSYGYQDFDFITPPEVNDTPGFIGGVTPSDTLPEVYAINNNYTLNLSSVNTNTLITFSDISRITTPNRVLNKEINIRESNSVFVTCSYKSEKCWIMLPGTSTIKEVDKNLNIKDLPFSISIDLPKIRESIQSVYDKNKLTRFNEDSQELLFFYEGKWQSIYQY